MGARWMVRGDIDGFFGLALDNLVQLLVIDTLCRFVLGFDSELLYGRVLPAAALSIAAGNFFYSWQAKKIADAEGRDDVCALPYGINTPAGFLTVYMVMLPICFKCVPCRPNANQSGGAWRDRSSAIGPHGYAARADDPCPMH